MKVRITRQHGGNVSFGGGPMREWPKLGSVIELDDATAEALVVNGDAEKVRFAKAEQVETRPAPTADVEVRRPGRPRKTD